MNREPGFYWVKKSGHESMIYEIDERRIVREEPSK